MPQKKKRQMKVKTSPVVHEMIDTKTEQLFPPSAGFSKPRRPMARLALIILVVALVGLFVANKGIFIAAIVDGKPIFRFQLNSVLVSRFGKQTLDGMISEMIIAGEARKAGVSITQEEIDVKTKALVDSLGGGMTIDQLLAYQGMTRADFDSQLRLQMTVEKLLGKDITITDGDIANFIATSGAVLTATDEAGMKEEARQAILSEKINEKLQPWFTDLKAKVNVLRFL
ncbi:hypothetical protein A2363_03350 [Candidatus Gottesmanbacteria bacterium RIFOXYB1_FULL_47_11]|uniref:PpiC domain-containing protein n=1 Tax=Candidatus Gottesmanbacteria bacterium RIFOXYB1_FULL_47_11 TaxID=1798401 RepID=A0A1F6BD91_9BACT|nr:MAG: hypothetical protein A2363_03350 [Candidatus Gottesmanbacteria bacterium RIFOXYB1_FULL_47_11]